MLRRSELFDYLDRNGKKPHFEYVGVIFDKNGDIFFRVYYYNDNYYSIPYKKEYVFKLFENPKIRTGIMLLHHYANQQKRGCCYGIHGQ